VYREGEDSVEFFGLKPIFGGYFGKIDFIITAQRQAFSVTKHFCGHHALPSCSEFLIINCA
jgi:hypothetical protein